MVLRLRQLLVPIAALALFGAACANDDDSDDVAEVLEGNVQDRDVTAEENPEPEPDPEAPAEPGVLRPGLQVTSVDFTTGVTVITNLGERDIDLTGHWICNRPSYAELPAQVLAPGQSVEASLGGFSADGGEVAIYTSDAFGDSEAISTYVSWGSEGGRQPVAEEAGIWSGDPVRPSGDTIELTGEPGSAAGWS